MPEAGSSVAKRRVRWRAPPLRKRESAFGRGTRKCASAARGAPVDGRRLGPLDPALLDEGAGKGGPGPRRLRATGPTGTTGDVRGRLRSATGEDNAPMGRPAREGGPTPRSPRGDAGGKKCRNDRSWTYAVKREAQPGSDCRKVVRRHAGQSRDRCWAHALQRSGGSLRGRRSASCVLGNRAISGARVGSRLQKSGRSTFFELQPGEPRGKPRERGVARVGCSSLDGDEWIEPERQGCEVHRANVKVNARLFARPQGRESNRWKASWAQAGVTLTGWRQVGSWYRDWSCP
jgi:hypothetical protein